MKKIVKVCMILILLTALALTLSCTAGPNKMVDTMNPAGETAGFWKGVWHGMIAGITFIISLFNENVAIYEIHNNGHIYDLGFIIGIIITFGGGSGAGCRSQRRDRD